MPIVARWASLLLLYVGLRFFSACGLVLCLLACWHLSNLGGKTLERGLLDPGDHPTYRRIDMTQLLDGYMEITVQEMFVWSKFLL